MDTHWTPTGYGYHHNFMLNKDPDDGSEAGAGVRLDDDIPLCNGHAVAALKVDQRSRRLVHMLGTPRARARVPSCAFAQPSEALTKQRTIGCPL